jgi:cation diffusion facilitator CzcD-associated flavoprotein CzcO
LTSFNHNSEASGCLHHDPQGSRCRCWLVITSSEITTHALISTGVSGLTTLKECLAAGFEATIFEAQGHIGGQWQYTDPDPVTGEVHSSIYQGTIFNSCRDTSSYSDFPMDPARYSVYTPHSQFVQYLHEYATFFNLLPKIRFGTKVLKCVQLEGGKWEVTYSEKESAKTETWDALFACTGHNKTPFLPQFQGLADFKGKFMHSHTYRTPSPFEGKKIAVIGVGSSGISLVFQITLFFVNIFQLLTSLPNLLLKQKSSTSLLAKEDGSSHDLSSGSRLRHGTVRHSI